MLKNVIILLLASALTAVLWVEYRPVPPPPAALACSMIAARACSGVISPLSTAPQISRAWRR